MLPKPHRLPPFLIREVLRQGKRVSAEGITLSFRANNIGTSRLAIIVPTRLDKRATARNRTKRLVRESMRLLLPRILSGLDVVIIVRRSLADLKENDTQEMLIKLFNSLRLLQQ